MKHFLLGIQASIPKKTNFINKLLKRTKNIQNKFKLKAKIF